MEEIITASSVNVSELKTFTSLEEILGPQRDSLYVIVPITIIYVIIFFTGLVGNISTCVVISRNKAMHTATNYYLYSLAISDLLLLVSGLPQEMYSIWSRYPYIFGHTFCVLRGLFSETSANATVLTITAFTVERYLAICHPFLSHTMSKLSRAVKFILMIWIVSIFFAVPQALQFEVDSLIKGVPESEICHVTHIIVPHSFEFSTFVFFLAPMSLITILYALIGLRLRSSNRMKKSSGDAHRRVNSVMRSSNGKCSTLKQRQGQSSRRVLKMLVAVVVAFFLCWAPFHVQRLVAIYGTIPTDHEDHKKFFKIYEIVTYISGILYYVSTTINPLLYNIMSNKFRDAFKETFAHLCGSTCIKTEQQERTYSILSRSIRRGHDSSTTSTYRDYPSFQGHDVTYTRKPSQESMIAQIPLYRNNNVRNGSKWSENNEYLPPELFPTANEIKLNEEKARAFWNIIVCVTTRRKSETRSCFSSPGHDAQAERFKLTDQVCTSCDISNSSLKDVDNTLLKDELSNYLCMVKYQQ